MSNHPGQALQEGTKITAVVCMEDRRASRHGVELNAQSRCLANGKEVQ